MSALVRSDRTLTMFAVKPHFGHVNFITDTEGGARGELYRHLLSIPPTLNRRGCTAIEAWIDACLLFQFPAFPLFKSEPSSRSKGEDVCLGCLLGQT